MSFYFLILFATILLSFVPERFIKPIATSYNFSQRIIIVTQSLIVTLLFLAVSLIVQRPIFSGLAVLIFHIILVVVNNTKYKALREPLLFSDIVMFSQAFKHPRLYFPFLDLKVLIFAPILIVSLIVAVLILEPALPITFKRIGITLLCILICYFLIRAISMIFNENQKHVSSSDSAPFNLGLINSLVVDTFQASTPARKQALVDTLKSSPFASSTLNTDPSSNTIKRNITVIQSESFFDARRLHPSIKKSVLENFDDCIANSIQHGKLNVPAWGANTMRTEFSFLSGLKNSDLGLYRSYPYQYIYDMPVSTIASALKAQGYYCVCIHPHSASFFGRDRTFPKMGFDEFIDVDCFEGAEKFGPYISDQAVTNKILEITKQITDKPLFIFAITMENHGPLHLEKIDESELATYYDQSALTSLDDLGIYLRHLKNADKMIKTLSQEYRSSERETTLCFYGDHVPSMPNVFDKLDYTDNHSDYFIWHSASSGPIENKSKTIDISTLGASLVNISK